MHNGMHYDPIQGQGQGQGHELLKVGYLWSTCSLEIFLSPEFVEKFQRDWLID